MEQLETRGNRQVKDRLFNIIMRSDEAKLELYNALNGTNYDIATDLLYS